MKGSLFLLSLLVSLTRAYAEDLPKKTMGTVSVGSFQLADSDGDGVADAQDLCPNTPVGTKVNAYGCPLESTQCDYTTSTVTLKNTGGSSGTGITTQYVLASNQGMILQISSTPSFTGLTGSASYMALALTYQGSISNLSVGQSLSTVSGSCFDWSDAYVFKACITPPTTCDYTSSTVTLNTSGGSAGTGIATRYLLTDTNDKILQISNTASFTGLSGTADYKAVAITYQGAISNLSIGQSLSLVNSSCFKLSSAIYFRDCVAPSACDYQIGQVITLAAAGGSTGTGVTTAYVLTNAAGVIVQVSTNPSFTSTSLSAGTYVAYSVVYTGNISNLLANGSNTITGVTGNCVVKSAGLTLKLCGNPCPQVCVPIVIKLVKR